MKQKKLILHVGFRKTATSSIQETLFRNKKLLEEQNIHYPEFVRASFGKWVNHAHMFISLFSEQPEKSYLYINRREGVQEIGAINAACREQFEMLLARKNCTVLISGEDIPFQPRELLKKIESEIRQHGWSIEVIAAVRSPLSTLASDYSQLVKSSLMPSSLYPACTIASRQLENLWSIFNTVRTYPFSEACGHPRGPVGYFLDFLGVENADNFEIFTENEGSSNNATRLLDYIYRIEPIVLNENKNPKRSLRDLKALWAIPGPKFRLTWEEYETVRDRIEFENAWLESNLGEEYCDDEIELRRSDVHWDEESLQAVRNALPEVPDVLVPYVHRYFEEERGIVLTQDAVPGLPECRPALERPEEVVRSVDERLRAGQLDEVSAIALLRSVIGGDEGDRLLYDRACELLLESGKSQEAVELAEDGLARFGGDLALMSRLGYACAAEGDTKRALDQWALVRQAHPSAEAGWIEGAMLSASLGHEREACELLGAYLAWLEVRLSHPWWDRVLSVVEIILLGYSEGRHVRGLLEALFLRPVAPDLVAHLKLFELLRWRDIPNYYQRRLEIFNLLRDIYRHSPIGRNDDLAIALELALGITAECQSPDRIREFIARLFFADFCMIFTLRRRYSMQGNFLLGRGDIHQEMIAALPVTDPDNAKKCLAVRYALGMDYGAAYEALTGSLPPTRREGYSDFAFASYAGNGRPKVAFCVSGQLRGYRKAFVSWKKSRLFVDCDVSTFVHTWPEIGAVPLDPNKGRRMFNVDFLRAFAKEWAVIGGMDKFGKAYPNLVRTVSQHRVVSAAELTEFYETPYVVVESEEPYRDYTNAEKMYYKIQACWELACACGEEFHFVFRIRPDLVLRDDSGVDWRMIVEYSQNKRMAYVGYLRFHRVGLSVEDELGFGNPAAMAVYSNTWSRAKDSNGLIRAHFDHLVEHTPIALNLVEHEVESALYPEELILDELAETKKPSLESLRGALEKDLTHDKRSENTLWQALEEDILHETKQAGCGRT